MEIDGYRSRLVLDFFDGRVYFLPFSVVHYILLAFLIES